MPTKLLGLGQELIILLTLCKLFRLNRAFRVSGEPTKKAAVTRARQAFIARREKRQIAELFCQLEWDASFDYKAERSHHP